MNGPISREPLRVAVRRVLVERVVSGDLEPGADLNELELCSELGVSRTPLRQALLHLEFEGFVDSEPGRGYWVSSLDLDGAADLYELVGALEALALRWSPLPEKRELEELDALNRRRARLGPEEVEQRIELDDQWHSLLLSGCRNDELLHCLSFLKNRLYRYEHAIAKAGQRVGASKAEHEAIQAALAEGDLDEAADLLERHWKNGINSVSAALDGD